MIKYHYIILALLLCVSQNVMAQEDDFSSDDLIGNDWPSVEEDETGPDCFDYYTFQSVIVSVSPEKELYQPGETITFSGVVTNENDYPIVDGNVFVRIGKYNEDYHQEGHYIVDEFFSLEDIVIDKDRSKNVSFTWTVPIEAQNGSYHASYFFVVGKKFNLGGLTFSHEITAGVSSFDIGSINDGFLSFDKEATRFNGEVYQHIGNWPVIEHGSDVRIDNVLNNTLDHDVSAVVTHELYTWDGMHEDNLISSTTSTIAVPVGSSADVTYAVPAVDRSVYYLKVTARQYDSQTINIVRFSVDNAGEPRLNYPAITQFPITKDESFTIFSCFHNAGHSVTSGTVTVEVKDKNGHEIGRAEYVGDISPAIHVTAVDIKAKDNYDFVTLTAQITNDHGQIIDQYETVYTCEALDACLETEMRGSDVVQSTAWWIYGVVAIVSIIIILVIVMIMRKVGHFSVLILLLGATLFFSASYAVDAAQYSVNSKKNYWHGNSNGQHSSMFVKNGSVTATHKISGNTEVGCNGSATYGYVATLEFAGEGGTWDTPYGKLCNNYTSVSCFGSNIVKPNYGNSLHLSSTERTSNKAYIYWTGKKPGVTLSSSDNSIVQCTGMTCAAKPGKSGTVTITARFAKTPVKIWSAVNLVLGDGGASSLQKIRAEYFWGTGAWVKRNKGDKRVWVSPSDSEAWGSGGKLKTDWYSTLNGQKGNTMNLDAKNLSFSLTVASCTEPGVCHSDAVRTDYPYTATQPSVPLCASGTSPVVVPQFAGYGADSEVTWTCSGIGGGQDSPLCKAQRMTPAATCGSADSVLTATSPIRDLCGSGSVLVEPPGVLFDNLNWKWSWSCRHMISGAVPQQVDDCSAPAPSPCACGTANGSVLTTQPTLHLCEPVITDVSVQGDGESWSWKCEDDGCIGSKQCAARCVVIEVDAPSSIYLTNDGQDVKARIKIDGNDHVEHVKKCTITGLNSTSEVNISNDGYSDYITFSSVTKPMTITAECELDVLCGNSGTASLGTYDTSHSITGMCANRSCNNQGTCQTVPEQAAHPSDCTSTCNSDADCSRGRMIETRP